MGLNNEAEARGQSAAAQKRLGTPAEEWQLSVQQLGKLVEMGKPELTVAGDASDLEDPLSVAYMTFRGQSCVASKIYQYKLKKTGESCLLPESLKPTQIGDAGVHPICLKILSS